MAVYNPSGVTIAFPSDAGHVDVTTIGCDKTGVTDCTATLQNYIKAHIQGQSNEALVLYYPSGTYLISGTILHQNSGGGWLSNVTHQGQNQATTFIKLKDGTFPNAVTAGAAAGAAGSFLYSNDISHVMFYTGGNGGDTNDAGNNNAFNNFFYDLTFQVGNNPGGGALGYLANNVGAIRRCTFTANSAYLLTDLGRGYNGPCQLCDVTYTGTTHDNWITNGSEYSMILTRITANNSPASGYSGQNQGIILGIENYTSTLPILNYDGYGAIGFAGTPVPTSNGSGANYFNTPGANGFKINPVPTPLSPYDAASTWVNAATHSGGLQGALNSGASTIYVPAGSNVTVSPGTTIPATVNRIICMHDGFSPASWSTSTPFFITQGTSSTPLTFERNSNQWSGPSGTDQNNYCFIQHSSTRDLVVMDWSGSGYVQGTTGGGRIFFEDVFLAVKLVAGNVFFGRQVNWEDPGVTWMVNNGGTAWVCGIKTEWPSGETFVPTIIGENGGRTEVMAGFSYPYDGAPSGFRQYQFTNHSGVIQWCDNASFTADINSSPVWTGAPGNGSRLQAASYSYQGG